MFSWRMARTHLGKISANIKNSKYGAVFKHCFLGALEFIPIIGQIISLAERKLYLISMKSDICKQLPHADHMKNNLENLSVIDRISLLRESHFGQEILKKPDLERETSEQLIVDSPKMVPLKTENLESQEIHSERVVKQSEQIESLLIPEKYQKTISDLNKKLEEIIEHSKNILQEDYSLEEITLHTSELAKKRDSLERDITKLVFEVDENCKINIRKICHEISRICSQVEKAILCFSAIKKVESITKDFSKEKFSSMITEEECRVISYFVYFDKTCNTEYIADSYDSPVTKFNQKSIIGDYFESILKTKPIAEKIFSRVRESVKLILFDDFFKKHHFVWLTGNTSSVFIGIKLLENHKEQAALVPSGQLFKKFAFKPFSGEMEEAGITKDHLSGMPMMGIDTCLWYSKKYIFNEDESEKTVFNFIKNKKEGVCSFNFPSVKTAIHRLISVKSRNISSIHKQIVDLQKKALKPDDHAQVNEILKIFEMQLTLPSLKEEDVQLLKHQFPIIWGSSNVRKKIERCRSDVRGEIVVQGKLVLGEDLQVAFTTNDKLEDLEEKLKNKKIRVFNLDTAALLAAAYSNRFQCFIETLIYK